MDYRKLIKEEIAKLHTAKGVKVNPKLDSDLGEQIVADICRKVAKNCFIPDVSKNGAVIFCENDFSTCVHQSFDKCTLKEKCSSQKMKAK